MGRLGKNSNAGRLPARLEEEIPRYVQVIRFRKDTQMNTFFKLRITELKGFMTAVFGNLTITPKGDNEFKVEWDSFATNELGVFDTMFGKESELMSVMILDAFFPGRLTMCSLLPESRDNFKPLFANSRYIKGFGTKIPVYVYPPKNPVYQRMVTVNMADMIIMYEYRNCLEALYLWVDKNDGSKEFFKG